MGAPPPEAARRGAPKRRTVITGTLHRLGLVATYRDSKKKFLERYAAQEG